MHSRTAAGTHSGSVVVASAGGVVFVVVGVVGVMDIESTASSLPSLPSLSLRPARPPCTSELTKFWWYCSACRVRVHCVCCAHSQSLSRTQADERSASRSMAQRCVAATRPLFAYASCTGETRAPSTWWPSSAKWSRASSTGSEGDKGIQAFVKFLENAVSLYYSPNMRRCMCVTGL